MTGLDEAGKERLLALFRASLDRSGNQNDNETGGAIESELGGDGDDDGDDSVDLRSLLEEMAVLKNEVRLQARQSKTVLEEMHALGGALREQNERLQAELDRARAQTAAVKAQAERGLLLGLLELRDRLAGGLDAAAAWRPSLLQRLVGGDRRFAQSLREGTALTLQRLDEMLDSHRVRAVAAVGQPLDPQTMHAVAVEEAPAQAAGVVLRELRRGYFQGSELLRTAEVIVNKKALSA